MAQIIENGREDRGSVKESYSWVMIKICRGKWTREEILTIKLERS
jgi:hypothetical protein